MNLGHLQRKYKCQPKQKSGDDIMSQKVSSWLFFIFLPFQRQEQPTTKKSGGKCSKCRWTQWVTTQQMKHRWYSWLSARLKWKHCDSSLQRLSESRENVIGSVLQQQFNGLTEKILKGPSKDRVLLILDQKSAANRRDVIKCLEESARTYEGH